ncbi:MAG: hypothetical protein Q9227_003411 [Pyrenula ochraceoflavens]
MSEEPTPDPAPKTSDPDAAQDTALKNPNKSWRRKYRKEMVKFEEKMRDSNVLFKEEQKMIEISRRLAEQTDAILDMLIEINDSAHVHPTYRYDLTPLGTRSPKREQDEIAPPTDDEIRGVRSALHEARQELKAGMINSAAYYQLERDILNSKGFEPRHSYTSLADDVPHKKPATLEHSQSGELGDRPPPLGYLTPRQEEHLYQTLDSQQPPAQDPRLNGSSSIKPPISADPAKDTNTNPTSSYARIGTDPRTAERDRDAQLRNPVSVYNWLRRHQPQVFLQDNEASHSSEKSSRAAGPRSSKRERARKEKALDEQQEGRPEQKHRPQEPQYDDDGIAVDTPTQRGGGGRGKRKRDEDGGYRPKGGNSRPAKRKRDGEEAPTGRGGGPKRGRKSREG